MYITGSLYISFIIVHVTGFHSRMYVFLICGRDCSISNIHSCIEVKLKSNNYACTPKRAILTKFCPYPPIFHALRKTAEFICSHIIIPIGTVRMSTCLQRRLIPFTIGEMCNILLYYTPDNITEKIRTCMHFDSNNFANFQIPRKLCAYKLFTSYMSY